MFAPLRDFFAAIFFFFFGLQIDPATLVGVLPLALALALVTGATKIFTGYLAARGTHVSGRERLRAGAALVARGEFSIVIAGLGVSFAPQIGPLSAAYVLITAVLGPLVSRLF